MSTRRGLEWVDLLACHCPILQHRHWLMLQKSSSAFRTHSHHQYIPAMLWLLLLFILSDMEYELREGSVHSELLNFRTHTHRLLVSLFLNIFLLQNTHNHIITSIACSTKISNVTICSSKIFLSPILEMAFPHLKLQGSFK